MIRDKIGCGKQQRGYCTRVHDGKRCYKKLGYISMWVILKIGSFVSWDYKKKLRSYDLLYLISIFYDHY